MLNFINWGGGRSFEPLGAALQKQLFSALYIVQVLVNRFWPSALISSSDCIKSAVPLGFCVSVFEDVVMTAFESVYFVEYFDGITFNTEAATLVRDCAWFAVIVLYCSLILYFLRCIVPHYTSFL